LAVEVRNDGGSGVCQVFRAAFPALASRAWSVASGAPFALNPNEARTLRVRFAPSVPGAVGSTLLLQTSSVDAPELRVAVSGRGGEECLLLWPRTLDLGTVQPGCGANTRTLTLRNACDATVSIANPRLADATGAFSLPARQPLAIAAHSDAELHVRFAPGTTGDFTGALLLESGGTEPLLRTVPLSGRGGAVHVERPNPTPAKFDVLWLVDDSCSMPLNVPRDVAAAYQHFLQHAPQPLDVHTAITTTSWSTTPRKGFPSGNFVNGPHGEIFGTGPRVLTPQMPDFQARLDSYFDVAQKGSAVERPMDSLRHAVTPALTPQNAGFRRPDARLALLVLTTDGASPDPAVLRAHAYAVRRFASSAYAPVVAGIVPTARFPAESCAYHTVGPDGFAGWDHWPNFMRLLDGHAEEFCDGNVASKMDRLGRYVFARRLEFPVSQAPAPGATITVRVDGVGMPEMGPTGATQWTWDASRRAVVFSPAAAPSAGARIEIEYVHACLP
ncbi:MAG: choice-of-anchor D domain-containing protein, partial [Myxococcales bacterium]